MTSRRISGLCCGNQACFTRTMAEALGRKPAASRFSKDMSKHITVLRDDQGRDATFSIMSKLVQWTWSRTHQHSVVPKMSQQDLPDCLRSVSYLWRTNKLPRRATFSQTCHWPQVLGSRVLQMYTTWFVSWFQQEWFGSRVCFERHSEVVQWWCWLKLSFRRFVKWSTNKLWTPLDWLDKIFFANACEIAGRLQILTFRIKLKGHGNQLQRIRTGVHPPRSHEK